MRSALAQPKNRVCGPAGKDRGDITRAAASYDPVAEALTLRPNNMGLLQLCRPPLGNQVDRRWTFLLGVLGCQSDVTFKVEECDNTSCIQQNHGRRLNKSPVTRPIASKSSQLGTRLQ